MCGISGYFGTRPISEEKIKTTLAQMKRRGPDSAAYFQHQTPSGKQVTLLSSRLNIIDLNDRANQPFRMGSKTLVYNGELYNYRELKQGLMKQGYPFRTMSDTEVLLQTLAAYPWKGLDKCEGMWAFAVFDEKENSLLLSRDRFGEKPLFLYQDPTGIYFGSEMKFIFTLLGHTPKINYQHLYRYMVNGYKSLYKVKDTFFEGVWALSPGTILRIDDSGTPFETRYWEPRFEPHEDMTYHEAVQGSRDALIKSLELRLRSDVPLAFSLSGGMDSNSLVSIAKRIFDYDVHGFTVTNTDARYTEQEMVEYSVKSLKIRHTAIPLETENFISNLRTLVRQHDAPVYTINWYAHWRLMEKVSQQGYRISISGTGADELFTGYYDHHNFYLYEVREDAAAYAKALQDWSQHIKPIVRNPYLQNPNVFIDRPEFRDHIFLNASEFSDFLYQGWSEPFSETNYCNGLLQNRRLNELFHESVPVILHEDDLNAMYYSIENRSPYLDRKLFEFCFQIPTRYLVKDGYAKCILRDAMKGIVPDRILDSHRKVGFNAPIDSFLDVHNKEVKNFLLNDSPIFEHVRRDKIEALINDPQLPNSESKFLFYFLNSKLFLEEFES